MTKRRIFALGFFDGVHLGHQALLRECNRLAEKYGCEGAAITFDRHPQTLFTHTPPKLLNTIREREMLLRRFGAETVRVLPVTKPVMGMPWEDFLGELMADGAAGFVCGYDFRFGHRGEGTAEKLSAFCQDRGLPCAVVPQQELDGKRISSTYIRQLLEEGEMEEAVRFLGHPHMLLGEVVSGRRIGRTIGVPTANILLPEGVVVPKLGVYACKASMDGQDYLAVTNVGSRPTVEGRQIRTESWILDFDGDLYGRQLTLEFYKFLRPEQKFDSLEELRAEIQKNALQTRKFFDKI